VVPAVMIALFTLHIVIYAITPKVLSETSSTRLGIAPSARTQKGFARYSFYLSLYRDPLSKA